MNIVFMGTPEYAVKILRAMVEFNGFSHSKTQLDLEPADAEGLLNLEGFEGMKFNITGIFTQPDKPVGRKQILTPSEVKIYAQQNLPNVPVCTPNSLKNEEVVEQICKMKPDFIVVAAYGKILPKSVLDIAPCINLHASILPKYRGASPIQSALLNGESQSGVTAMLMDVGLDTGDMLAYIYTPCERKTAGELFDELGFLGGELIVRVLLNFKSLTPVKQDNSRSSECKKIQKADGVFSFDEDARQIYNKFRAFTPWPGISLASGLKILDIEPACEFDERKFERTGEILKVEKDSFVVSCKTGALLVKALQEPSKKAINAGAYINGKRLGLGNFIC